MTFWAAKYEGRLLRWSIRDTPNDVIRAVKAVHQGMTWSDLEAEGFSVVPVEIREVEQPTGGQGQS